MPRVKAGFSAPFLTGAGAEAVSEPDGGVRLWRLRGTADSPRGAPGQDPWNAWRHRHGYMLSAAGYRWNTLGDHPEALTQDLGQFFDEHLRAVWKHWAARPQASSAVPDERIEMELSVPGPTRYALSLWGASMEVRLDVVKGRRDWLYDLASPASWDLSRAEWRRRHLYGPGDARLDALMERCAAYWAEATAHLLLVDLDAKLRAI